MKKGKILIAVGVMVLVLGIYFAVFAVLPTDDTENVTIPAGEWYYVFSLGGIIGGSVDVDYTVADGSIHVFVFNSDQYAEYESTGVAQVLYSHSGDSGSFTFDLPDSGTYYIVLEHGLLSVLFDQDVAFQTTISGTSITGIVTGVVLIVVGAVIAFYGSKLKARESVAAPPPPQTGVTFFQGQQQNPPGQA
ncbi:MAG TPA: hypothetical protein VF374_06125 [Thermoplasmata archaeon]|jgi:uncharacterized membrane protein